MRDWSSSGPTTGPAVGSGPFTAWSGPGADLLSDSGSFSSGGPFFSDIDFYQF